MIKRIERKIIAYLLVISQIIVLTSFLTTFAKEQSEYAEVDLSNGRTYRCKTNNDGFKSTGKAGRIGLQSSVKGGKHHIYVDIDDDFMYNVPEGVPVDITVEYYDEYSNAKFCVQYDSHNLTPLVANNELWNVSETVYGKGTKKWTSHTFKLTDLKATNRANGKTDFRVQTWIPGNGNSEADIVFGKITVKYGDFDSYLEFEGLDSEYVGNVFSKEEEIKLNIDLIGRAMGDTAVGRVKYSVFDTSGNNLYGGEYETEADFGENISHEVTIPNPGRYDLYDVEIEIESWHKSNPEKKSTFKTVWSFAVAMVFDPKEGAHNTLLGVCQQIGSKNWGGRREVAEMVARAGFGYIRDDSTMTTYQNGRFVVNDDFMEMYRMLKEDFGIEPFVILDGSGDKNASWSFFNPPHTEKQYADYAQYAYDVADQTKGLVKYFELWNEYNIKVRENDPLATPEYYANTMQPAAKRIKETNPDAVVLGITAAGESQTGSDRGTAPEFTKNVFNSGGHNGLDYVSVHPYDWTGGFRIDRFIRDAKEIQQVIDETGSGQKLWMDEFGWGTAAVGSQSFARDRQYQLIILQLAIAHYYTNYERSMLYAFADQASVYETNLNWGLVNWWNATDKTPYGAKESYLAMTAYNQFLGNCVADKAFEDEECYAFHYNNERMGKDIILLISNTIEKTMSLDLGTNSVEIYDAYGNKLSNLNSSDNIYDLAISQDPVYVVGNFGKFEQVQNRESKVKADSTRKQAAIDDIAVFELTKNIDKPLSISVDGIEVYENKGFVGNRAILKVKTPADENKKVSFVVTASDENGNVYYCRKHFIDLVAPVVFELNAEKAEIISKNRWRIRAKVKNVSQSKTFSGQLEILKPLDMAQYNKTLNFNALEAGEERVFFFNMPEKVSKDVVEVATRLTLSNGYTVDATEKICFSQATYAHQKPVIDGVIGQSEWNGSWIGSSSSDNIISLLPIDWKGKADLSYNATMMWDEENLYFMAAINDDAHYVGHTPGGVDNIWRGDSIQLGLDDRESTNTVMTNLFTELTIGEVPGVGNVVYKGRALYDSGILNSVIEDAEIMIKRYDGYTLYECSIPWDGIFYENYVLRPDAPFKLSALINDNDGDGRKFYLEYTSGIGASKNTELFGEMVFVK